MLKHALKHFKKVDPKLYCAYRELKGDNGLTPERSDDYFKSLCRIIVGQQLSGAAANSIWNRFDRHFKTRVTPRKVRGTSEGSLRNIGMSWAKVRSLRDLSGKVVAKQLILKNIETLDDEAVREQLLIVRGVGPWSIEMFLMFSLGREDVFSYGDLGLRKSIEKIYALRKSPSEKALNKITRKWSPYRTYAACILWRHVDDR